MKRMKVLLLLLFILFGNAYAQKKVITGTILNKETGKPILGANIVADKSKNGTSSNAKGEYSINLKSTSTLLIFSCIGYTTQTILIEDKSVIDVNMIPSYTDNTEVVVIGYGTQKRADVTGAISKYKNDKLIS